MRDNRLDIIRGFAILLLTTTHTSPGPELLGQSGHYYIRLGLFFHGADLFVAFSGLVCGLVYKRLIEREGAASGIHKGLSRALQLFIYNLCALCCVGAVILIFRAGGIQAPVHHFSDSFPKEFMGTALLYNPIPFFNILNFYILMLVALPFFVIVQMRWTWPVMLSFLIYAGYSLYVLVFDASSTSGRFFVSPLAWQFLFFAGTTVGMNYSRVRTSMPALSKTIGPIMLYILATHFMRDQQWIVHNLSGKYDLGFLRIIDLIIFCYVVDQLVRPDIKITARPMKLISSIGSNSLFCFSVTLVLCYTTSLFLVVFDGSRAIYLLALLIEIGLMLTLGHLLLTRTGFRAATQIKWVESFTKPFLHRAD